MPICVCGNSESYPGCDRDSCYDPYPTLDDLRQVRQDHAEHGRDTSRSDLEIRIKQIVWDD